MNHGGTRNRRPEGTWPSPRAPRPAAHRGTAAALRYVLGDLGAFSRGLTPARALRGYQLEAAGPIVRSVLERRGGQFAIVFSRQAGKDETLAQLVAYLLALHQRAGGGIVFASPTLRPQSEISRRRLVERLEANPLTRPGLALREGNVVALGRAEARYLSAAPGANARGATASLLLVCNEAQDVDPDRWDAVFDPMAASTNATTVFSGTVWSDKTLLARQMRHLRRLEREDGTRRVFLVPWRRVAEDVPAYGERVRARIAQFGAGHPFVRTEYELEELPGAGGLFGPARRAQLRGEHARERRGEAGRVYALLVDVAGEDEGGGDGDEGASARATGTRRDSTALTVVEVVPPGRGGLPQYRVLDRRLWTGVSHTSLHATLVDLAKNVWRARRVAVDATGVGAGLASFLAAALAGRVVPVTFSQAVKSDLGWAITGMIDAGRLKEYAPDGTEETTLFWQQLEACDYEVRPGPGKIMRWGVADPRLHDDLVLSLALVGALDEEDWRPRTARGSAG